MSRSSTKPTKPTAKKEKPRASRRKGSADPTGTPGSPGEPAKLSGLDAAAQVLRDAGEALTTQDLVKRMLDSGLWATKGKTPAATLYSAMIREISAKGSASRFRKGGPGLFTAAT